MYHRPEQHHVLSIDEFASLSPRNINKHDENNEQLRDAFIASIVVRLWDGDPTQIDRVLCSTTENICNKSLSSSLSSSSSSSWDILLCDLVTFLLKIQKKKKKQKKNIGLKFTSSFRLEIASIGDLAFSVFVRVLPLFPSHSLRMCLRCASGS